jgi:hypothetical protein
MSPEEATWFGNALSQTAVAELSPMLNVGSSTLEYRTIVCPCIDQILLGPLRSRGVRVLHIDLKANDGVDIVGDILDPSVRSHIASLGVKSILCNNLLEHVENLPETCKALAQICPPGGRLYLSVPNSFPFHPDPIDNGFRASPKRLEEIFTPLGFRFVQGATVDFGSYGKAVAGNPKLVLRDIYLLLLSPFIKEKRKVLLGNYWFFLRNFRVTCTVFSMNESPGKSAPCNAATLGNPSQG